MKRQRNRRGLLVTLFLAAVLGTSAYAFTATNTISDPGTAGDGVSGSMVGYDVTAGSVHYDSSDDTNITSVSFDLSPANTGTVKAALNGGALSPACSGSAGGTHFVCDVSGDGITITASDTLRVVAFG
jgi:hypothetical protein